MVRMLTVCALVLCATAATQAFPLDPVRAMSGPPPFLPGSLVASHYNCETKGQCSKPRRRAGRLVQVTANGEAFNKHAMTTAHKSLPFGTRLEVCLRGCVVVRVNDRGPFVRGRGLDLTTGAARAIGMSGVASVRVRRVS